MDVMDLKALIAKAKNISIEEPVKKQKKRRHRPSKATQKEQKQKDKISRTMEKFVDFDISYEIHRNSYNIVVISVKGHVKDHTCINSKFIESIEEELYGRGSCCSNRLILDLRRVFFVSKEVTWSLLVHQMPWLHMCFDKVAIVLPPSQTVQRNLTNAYYDWGKPPGFEYRVVERASDAREFINN